MLLLEVVPPSHIVSLPLPDQPTMTGDPRDIQKSTLLKSTLLKILYQTALNSTQTFLSHPTEHLSTLTQPNTQLSKDWRFERFEM